MKPGLLMLPSAVSDSRVHNILPNKIDTDFQFSRASAATRVNHQGLIENVGYFSDELVRNGNFSELGSELAPAADFGTSNFVSTPASGTAVNSPNGTLTFTNSTSVGTQVQLKNRSITTTKTYKIQFTISNYVAGTFRMSVGNQITNSVSANGSYVFYVEYTSGADRNYFYTNNSTLTVSNISVKQVDPDGDWILGTGWSFGDNKVIFDGGADAAVTQSPTVEPSTLYRASFTVADRTTGSLQLRLGNSGVVDVTVTNNGNFSFDLTTDATGTSVYFRAIGGFNGSVSNVSVKQILGDKPRLNYDPINPTCPHLLLEPQSTNLIKFSNDYTQSEWNKISGATVDANVEISPDGTLNASRLNFDTVSGSRMEDQIPGAASGDYSFAVYLKADEPKTIGIRTGFAGTPTVNVNVTTEWQRFSITQNNPTNPANGYAQIRSIDASGGSVYVWGAQIEQLSYSTSLIPTSGSTETRVGETCTNAGNLNTFNSEEGVLYAEMAALADDLTFRSISINDGTNNEAAIIRFRTNSNRINGLIRDGGSAVNNLNFDVTDITDFNKVAYKFKTGDCALFINGTEVATGTSAFTLSPLVSLDFNNGNPADDLFYGKVKSLATYNRALTDTELYTITSTQYSAYSGMVAALGNYTIPC